MSDQDVLSASLCESIATCLCLIDDEPSALIATQVEPKDFEHPYNELVARALTYRARYGYPPGLEHIDDVFDDLLTSPNERIARQYSRILEGMLAQHGAGVNTQYVATRIGEHCRRKILIDCVVSAANRYQQGGDNLSEDLEEILWKALSNKRMDQDLGSFFNDQEKLIGAFTDVEEDYINIGIPELETRGINLSRRQLMLFLAARGRGKSFFAVHCGKLALQQRWKVLHITLEMEERSVIQRYVQSLLGYTRRDTPYPEPQVKLDEHGAIVDWEAPTLTVPTDNFEREGFVDDLLNAIKKLDDQRRVFGNLIINKFPTGQLTIRQLENYLDSLELVHKFTPDLLIVDYPALMKIDITQPAISLGNIVVNLRGIADKRNCALLAPVQTNRSGESSRDTRTHQTAQDISMIATADCVLTYSQTEVEKDFGCARIFVNKARNEQDHFTVVIKQSYATGQFALDSGFMQSDHHDRLEALHNRYKPAQEDENDLSC